MNRLVGLFSSATLLLVLLGICGPARASLVRPYTLAELGREADGIFVGKVQAAESFWNEAHDTIYTQYRIEVSRTVKGQAVTQVLVRLMGGTVGQDQLVVAGNPSLEVGEEVLLCLRQVGDFHVVIGMRQGKWSLLRHTDQTCVVRGARPALDGLAIENSATERSATDTLAIGCGGRMSLDELIEQLLKEANPATAAEEVVR